MHNAGMRRLPECITRNAECKMGVISHFASLFSCKMGMPKCEMVVISHIARALGRNAKWGSFRISHAHWRVLQNAK